MAKALHKALYTCRWNKREQMDSRCQIYIRQQFLDDRWCKGCRPCLVGSDIGPDGFVQYIQLGLRMDVRRHKDWYTVRWYKLGHRGSRCCYGIRLLDIGPKGYLGSRSSIGILLVGPLCSTLRWCHKDRSRYKDSSRRYSHTPCLIHIQSLCGIQLQK